MNIGDGEKTTDPLKCNDDTATESKACEACCDSKLLSNLNGSYPDLHEAMDAANKRFRWYRPVLISLPVATTTSLRAQKMRNADNESRAMLEVNN